MQKDMIDPRVIHELLGDLGSVVEPLPLDGPVSDRTVHLEADASAVVKSPRKRRGLGDTVDFALSYSTTMPAFRIPDNERRNDAGQIDGLYYPRWAGKTWFDLPGDNVGATAIQHLSPAG